MQTENEKYLFFPPGAAKDKPIHIQFGRHYSTSQQRKSDLWVIRVPAEYRNKLPETVECRSFQQVERILSAAFFDGDDTKVTFKRRGL
jgi:hypothetical protein